MGNRTNNFACFHSIAVADDDAAVLFNENKIKKMSHSAGKWGN